MTSSTQVRGNSLARAGAAIAAAAAAGSIGCLIVATIAKAAGASKDFRPLTASAYVALVILASIIGALGWIVISRRSADPGRTLSRLVPVVVAVSLVPDLLVGFGNGMAHSSWGAVVALMIMHPVVAAAAVTSYRRFLPVKR